MPPDPLSRYLLAQARNNAWADHRLLRACSALSHAEFVDGPRTPCGHNAKLGTYPCFQEIFRAAEAAGHAPEPQSTPALTRLPSFAPPRISCKTGCVPSFSQCRMMPSSACRVIAPSSPMAIQPPRGGEASGSQSGST